ncbi:hypothetical protein ACJBU6_02972 [Exserohilum turcicum]
MKKTTHTLPLFNPPSSPLQSLQPLHQRPKPLPPLLLHLVAFPLLLPHLTPPHPLLQLLTHNLPIQHPPRILKPTNIPHINEAQAPQRLQRDIRAPPAATVQRDVMVLGHVRVVVFSIDGGELVDGLVLDVQRRAHVAG